MLSERTQIFLGVLLLGLVFIFGWILVCLPDKPQQQQVISQSYNDDSQRSYTPAEEVAIDKLATASEAFANRDIETALTLSQEVAADKTLADDLHGTSLTLSGICLMLENRLDEAELNFNQVLALKNPDPRDIMTSKNGLKIIAHIRTQKQVVKPKSNVTII